MAGTGLPAHALKWGAIRLKITAMSGSVNTGPEEIGADAQSIAAEMAAKNKRVLDVIRIKIVPVYVF
jgi:hypothetical protein